MIPCIDLNLDVCLDVFDLFIIDCTLIYINCISSSSNACPGAADEKLFAGTKSLFSLRLMSDK